MVRVLTAGSAVIDFVFRLDSLPREAAKYHAHAAETIGGGCAANAAAAIVRLGGQGVVATALGADLVGDMVVQGLEADGVDTSAILRVPGRQSSYSSVFLDSEGERQIVNFRDEEVVRAARLVLPKDGRFDAVLADARWPELAANVTDYAAVQGVPGVLDVEAPVLVAEETLQRATHIGFSEDGLADYTGSDDIKAALQVAARRTGTFVCVTLGSRGSWFLGQNGRVEQVPAFPVNAVETLGAGDVWHGAFAFALAEGRPEPNAISFANAAAALKCARVGGRSSYPTRSEMMGFLAGC